jgi:hypothetical protein
MSRAAAMSSSFKDFVVDFAAVDALWLLLWLSLSLPVFVVDTLFRVRLIELLCRLFFEDRLPVADPVGVPLKKRVKNSRF